MMSLEEEDMEVADTELRDLVEKTLERAGVLGRIKAELRASVFLALEDDDRWKAKRLPVKLCESTSSEPRGKGALGLVREFMEFFNLDFTLSVFDEETRPETCMSRAELIKEFDIKDARPDLPIILHLLRSLDEKRSSSKSVDDDDDNRSQYKNDVAKSFQTSSQDLSETKAKAPVDPMYDPFFDDPLPSMDSRSVLDNQSIFENKQLSNPSVSDQGKDPFNYMAKNDEYERESSVKSKQQSDSFSKDHLEMLKLSNAFPSVLEDVGRENSLTSLKDLPSLTSKPLSVASDSSSSWSFPKKSPLFFDDELNLSKHSGKGDDEDADSSNKSMIKSLMQDLMQNQHGGRSESRNNVNSDYGMASNFSVEVSVDTKLDANQDGDSISGSELSMKSKLGSVLSHSSGDNDDDENSGSELSIRSRLESFLPDISLDKNDLNDSQDNTEQSIEEEIDDELLSSISIGEETTNDETVSHISITGCDFMESIKQKGMIKGQK